VRKITAILLLICLTVCLSGCVFENVSLFYNEYTEANGLLIAVNDMANCCFVGKYTCKDYNPNQAIIIPDAYDNKPITRIGGYYGRGVPTPFYISLAELYMNAPEGSDYAAVYSGDIQSFDISDNYRVEDVVFRLYIGQYINTISYVAMEDYYPHINDDGSITFYHPVVNIVCSEDNPHFYSENGKLYHKNSRQLVEDFSYVTP